jgi:hypothetical protein
MREKTVLMVALLMAAAGAASAGTLADDPNALVYDGTTWQDTITMSSSTLSVTVDYVVLHEDDWSYGGYTPTSDPNFPGLPVYCYAYQIWCNDTTPVMDFWVAMIESNEARQIGTFTVDAGDTEAVAPADCGLANEQALWTWRDEGLTQGEHSVGLVYTSVNWPTDESWAFALDDALWCGWPVASPSADIPEPATLGLLAIGAVALVRRRR